MESDDNDNHENAMGSEAGSGSDSGSGSESSEEIETLAAGREKRVTAGNRLAALLLHEDEGVDELYRTGDKADEDDDDFDAVKEVKIKDDADLEFESESSDNEDGDEGEDEGERELRAREKADRRAAAQRAKERDRKKAEKGFKLPRYAQLAAGVARAAPVSSHKRKRSADHDGAAASAAEKPLPAIDPSIKPRESSRAATKAATTAIKKKLKSEAKAAKTQTDATLVRQIPQKTIWTQEMLLEEARETEKRNVASLEAFWRREEEEKQEQRKRESRRGIAQGRALHPGLIWRSFIDCIGGSDEETDSADSESFDFSTKVTLALSKPVHKNESETREKELHADREDGSTQDDVADPASSDHGPSILKSLQDSAKYEALTTEGSLIMDHDRVQDNVPITTLSEPVPHESEADMVGKASPPSREESGADDLVYATTEEKHTSSSDALRTVLEESDAVPVKDVPSRSDALIDGHSIAVKTDPAIEMDLPETASPGMTILDGAQSPSVLPTPVQVDKVEAVQEKQPKIFVSRNLITIVPSSFYTFGMPPLQLFSAPHQSASSQYLAQYSAVRTEADSSGPAGISGPITERQEVESRHEHARFMDATLIDHSLTVDNVSTSILLLGDAIRTRGLTSRERAVRARALRVACPILGPMPTATQLARQYSSKQQRRKYRHASTGLVLGGVHAFKIIKRLIGSLDVACRTEEDLLSLSRTPMEDTRRDSEVKTRAAGEDFVWNRHLGAFTCDLKHLTGNKAALGGQDGPGDVFIQALVGAPPPPAMDPSASTDGAPARKVRVSLPSRLETPHKPAQVGSAPASAPTKKSLPKKPTTQHAAKNKAAIAAAPEIGPAEPLSTPTTGKARSHRGWAYVLETSQPRALYDSPPPDEVDVKMELDGGRRSTRRARSQNAS